MGVIEGDAMKTMHYNGYDADFGYSSDDDCFVGNIAGIDDVVGFHAESIQELLGAFDKAVDDYIEFCEELNRSPQKPSLRKVTV